MQAYFVTHRVWPQHTTPALFSYKEEKAMERYDLPARPEGTTEQQLTQLWEALFRLIERLNAEKKGA